MRKMNRLAVCLSLVLCLLPGLMFGIDILPAMASEEYSGCIQITQNDMETKQPVAGIRLALYQIAVSTDGSNNEMQLTDSFRKSGLDIASLHEKNRYEENIKIIDRYIEEEKIQEKESQVTGTDGKVDFTDLPDGLYFVKQINNSEDFEKLGYVYSTDSFFVELPRIDEEGGEIRVVQCQPKGKLEYPEELKKITVYKVWKDNSNEAGKRPDEISVGLYRNGSLEEKVVLSAANNWTFQWEALDSHEDWDIREIDIPAGYRSEISVEEGAYTIMNTWTETPESSSAESSSSPTDPEHTSESEKPHGSGADTGDSSNILLFFVLMMGSLSVLAAAACFQLRKRKENQDADEG